MKEKLGKPNVCCDCGEPGGTLVKVGDEYRHSNPSWCKTLKKLAKGIRLKNRKERRVKEK
jgi:hypothetical protein